MPGTSQDNELRAAGDRIEALMGELAAASPAVQGKAEELVRLLMQLYGAGLDRILTVVDDAGQAAAGPIFASLAADDLVASLMILHDLHPLDLETRVARALDHVRPYLGSHGGDVKLLSVEEGVVLLRLEGSCQGCPSSKKGSRKPRRKSLVLTSKEHPRKRRQPRPIPRRRFRSAAMARRSTAAAGFRWRRRISAPAGSPWSTCRACE
jgi:Fe-S cluster biogenesis protein NfuA